MLLEFYSILLGIAIFSCACVVSDPHYLVRSLTNSHYVPGTLEQKVGRKGSAEVLHLCPGVKAKCLGCAPKSLWSALTTESQVSRFTLEQTDSRHSQKIFDFHSGWLSPWRAHSCPQFKVVTTLLQRQPQVCPPNFYPLNDLLFLLFFPPCWAGIALEWTGSGSFK